MKGLESGAWKEQPRSRNLLRGVFAEGMFPFKPYVYFCYLFLAFQYFYVYLCYLLSMFLFSMCKILSMKRNFRFQV